MQTHITNCPHCGNNTQHKRLSDVSVEEPLFDETGSYEGSPEVDYYLVQCTTCSQVSLLSDWELSEEERGVLSHALLLYPHQKRFGDEVPLVIRTTFFEAKKVKRISPMSFAILARKTLEMICADKEAKGRNLKEKIKSLTTNKVLPDTLNVISEAVRFFGNESAHSNDIAINSNQVDLLDDLVNIVIEYVYIVPSKIKKLQESTKRNERTAESA